MGRVEIDDLCGFCRGLTSMYGLSVEDTLKVLYNDPAKWVECGGHIGVLQMLNEAIVLGEGCTTCGAKVLSWARELGVIR